MKQRSSFGVARPRWKRSEPGVRIAVAPELRAVGQLGEHRGLDLGDAAQQRGRLRAQRGGRRMRVVVPLQVEALPAGLEERVEAGVVVRLGRLDLLAAASARRLRRGSSASGRSASSDAGTTDGSRYGVVGTPENAYMNTLIGAVNVEWSNTCRPTCGARGRADARRRRWREQQEDEDEGELHGRTRKHAARRIRDFLMIAATGARACRERTSEPSAIDRRHPLLRVALAGDPVRRQRGVELRDLRGVEPDRVARRRCPPGSVRRLVPGIGTMSSP